MQYDRARSFFSITLGLGLDYSSKKKLKLKFKKSPTSHIYYCIPFGIDCLLKC